ncbi:hypothetical protein, partial [Mycobacterium avium]|uniref:hypothetical protein n=1 Tax=Mycobacterium avium TaxID=1764 RepID=UPI001EE770AB
GEACTYTTPVVTSANWFDARISCSFGSTRDVFPNDLWTRQAGQLAQIFDFFCVARVYCAL